MRIFPSFDCGFEKSLHFQSLEGETIAGNPVIKYLVNVVILPFFPASTSFTLLASISLSLFLNQRKTKQKYKYTQTHTHVHIWKKIAKFYYLFYLYLVGV